MPETLEVIESTEAITAILKTFRDIRTPLSITTPPSKKRFNSFLLKSETSQLHINLLVPIIGNRLLQPGQTIEIGINHQGIAYFFKSRHLGQSMDDTGFAYHQISLPTQVQYLDNRTSYRIHIKLAESPVVHISTANEAPVQTRCENISENGACLLVYGDSASVKPDELIDCTIQLPGLGLIDCKAVVKYQLYCANTRKGEISKIGIEFRQLPTSTHSKLNKALMKMQRHNLRSSITP